MDQHFPLLLYAASWCEQHFDSDGEHTDKAVPKSDELLPPSFVKLRDKTQRRKERIAQCKRMLAALKEGEPLPADIEIDEELLEIQKLLLQGVPEDVICGNKTRTLLSMTRNDRWQSSMDMSDPRDPVVIPGTISLDLEGGDEAADEQMLSEHESPAGSAAAVKEEGDFASQTLARAHIQTQQPAESQTLAKEEKEKEKEKEKEAVPTLATTQSGVYQEIRSKKEILMLSRARRVTKRDLTAEEVKRREAAAKKRGRKREWDGTRDGGPSDKRQRGSGSGRQRKEVRPSQRIDRERLSQVAASLSQANTSFDALGSDNDLFGILSHDTDAAH